MKIMNAKEFILENDEEAREAVFNGYELRMSEPELLEWMEKYSQYKAENLPTPMPKEDDGSDKTGDFPF